MPGVYPTLWAVGLESLEVRLLAGAEKYLRSYHVQIQRESGVLFSCVKRPKLTARERRLWKSVPKQSPYARHEATSGSRGTLPTFSASALDGGDQLHAPAGLPPGINASTHSVRRLVVPRAGVHISREETILLLSGIEPPDRPPRSLVSIPTTQAPILQLYIHSTAMPHNGLWPVVARYVSLFLYATKALRVSRGIALLFLGPSALDGVGVQVHAPAVLPPGKTRDPFYRRLGGSQDRCGRARNLVPTGIRSRTVQPVAQSLYRLSYRADAGGGGRLNYVHLCGKKGGANLFRCGKG